MAEPIPIDDGMFSPGAQITTGLGSFILGRTRVGSRQHVDGQNLSPQNLAFAADSEPGGVGPLDEVT